jgi:hypothetical protein
LAIRHHYYHLGARRLGAQMTLISLLLLAYISGYSTAYFIDKRKGRRSLSSLNDTLDVIQEQLDEIKEFGFENFAENFDNELSISDIKRLLDEMNSPSEDDETQTEATPDNESRE